MVALAAVAKTLFRLAVVAVAVVDGDDVVDVA